MSIGENLWFFRKKQGLSQKELAEKIHVSERTIGHYETGAREPSVDMLTTLGSTLGVRVEDFLRLLSREEFFSIPQEMHFVHWKNDELDVELLPFQHSSIDPFQSFLETSIQRKLIYFPVREIVSVLPNEENLLLEVSADKKIVEYEGKKIPFLEIFPKCNNHCILILQKGEHLFAVGVEAFIGIIDYPCIIPLKNPLREALDAHKDDLNYAALYFLIEAARMNWHKLRQLSNDIRELIRLIDGAFSFAIIEKKIDALLHFLKEFTADDHDKLLALTEKNTYEQPPVTFHEMSNQLFEMQSLLYSSKI